MSALALLCVSSYAPLGSCISGFRGPDVSGAIPMPVLRSCRVARGVAFCRGVVPAMRQGASEAEAAQRWRLLDERYVTEPTGCE